MTKTTQRTMTLKNKQMAEKFADLVRMISSGKPGGTFYTMVIDIREVDAEGRHVVEFVCAATREEFWEGVATGLHAT